MSHVVRFHRLLVPLLAALGAACAAASTDGATDGADAVIGGRLETRFPGVGYLTRSGVAQCSAALVEPDLVLTAAHCVDHGQDVAFGWGQVGEHETIAATVAMHPRYQEPEGNGGVDRQGFDIALLRLARPAPVERLSLAPTPRSGRVLAVGYGSTAYEKTDAGKYESSGVGTERKSTEGVIVSTNPVEVFTRFEVGSSLCYGDSGSPLLVDGRVVGTLSRFVGTTRCRPEHRTMMAYTRVEGMERFFAHAKECLPSADVAACLREDARKLCATPRFSTAASPATVRPSTGDAEDGSFSFDLREAEAKGLRLPAVARRTTLSIFAQGDATGALTHAGRVLGTGVSELILEPGAPHDVVVRSCAGVAQGVTLVWAPAP